MEEIVQLVARFSRLISKELVNNNRKKGSSWKDESIPNLFAEIQYHEDKLRKAVALDDKQAIKEHAADVAIYAMFVAEKAGQ